MDDLTNFIDSVIEEYRDGRVNPCLMISYLNQMKQMASGTAGG